MKLTADQIADRVLAGDSNPTWNPTAKHNDPRPPASDTEIARIKRSIEVQLDEYEAAINAATAWSAGWRARRPRGFKAKRSAHD